MSWLPVPYHGSPAEGRPSQSHRLSAISQPSKEPMPVSEVVVRQTCIRPRSVLLGRRYRYRDVSYLAGPVARSAPPVQALRIRPDFRVRQRQFAVPLTTACGGDHYDIGCDSLDRWSRRSLYRQSPSEQLLRKPFSADRFDRCLQQLYMLDQPREFDGIDFVLR
jgi:hypothetical protein